LPFQRELSRVLRSAVRRYCYSCWMVVETKLDRLGRSTRELLDLIERIGKVGVVFRDQDHARSQYA
jgi:DNA invertase Pin-like site-specific DNA recombinase